jgi:SAM-dependent methyltransferase
MATLRAETRRIVRGVKRRVRKRLRRMRNRLPGRQTTNTPLQSASGQQGIVEVFTNREIAGWVAVKNGGPPVRITVRVNQVDVVATWAVDAGDLNSWGEVRSFRIALYDLWRYCKTSDRVSVRAGERTLPIVQKGMFFRPPRNGAETLTVLESRLAEGYLFGQTGRLQLSKTLDVEWQKAVMRLYNRVRAVVKRDFGYDVFFCYGTLLGAVRDNGFIGHDVDFDAAYISKQSDGQAAARELQDIAFMLIDEGLRVKCMRTALHIYAGEPPTARIDLFHLYFGADEKLAFPFGVAGVTEVPMHEWEGTREIEFGGGRGLIPVAAEALTEHIYGPNWRVPQPGFNWNRDRARRAREGTLPIAWGEEVYWANFYAHTTYSSASPFFEAVHAIPDLPDTVIDIGCGEGRDSYAFAKAGRRVLGLDQCQVGIRQAKAKAPDLGPTDALDFMTCDIGDGEAFRSILSEAIAQAGGGPIVFYLRFFLHAVPAEVQDVAMAVLSECARAGDYFAAEFRTDKDEAKPKAHAKHYRRFQNGPAFGARLQDEYGFKILDEQEGTGMSPYRGEDPELYRVVACRELNREAENARSDWPAAMPRS